MMRVKVELKNGDSFLWTGWSRAYRVEINNNTLTVFYKLYEDVQADEFSLNEIDYFKVEETKDGEY